MAPPLQTQEAGRRFPGGLTGNALLSGIIAAIVSGLISFYVVHWQSQAAARQAVTSQQVAAAVQLQSAAETFDQVVDHLYWSDVKCAAEYTSSCDQTVIRPIPSLSRDHAYGVAGVTVSVRHLAVVC